MIHLILNEQGKPEHRWSSDPGKDFAGLTIIGPAIRDENGAPEDNSVLDLVDGKVVVNAQKKSIFLQAKEAELNSRKARQASREARVSARRSIDLNKINTVAEIKAALKIVIDSLED